MAEGPAAGLELADRVAGRLADYHLLPSVRGDLLAKLGRSAEARAEFERAAGLTANGRERDLLLARARECARARPGYGVADEVVGVPAGDPESGTPV
jgi:RNA polymerase sigma-70 factor (ECF subfamily)